MVQHENIECIVLGGIGQSYAGGSYGVGESHVQDEVWVVGVRSLADVGSAKAQDMVVLEYPP